MLSGFLSGGGRESERKKKEEEEKTKTLFSKRQPKKKKKKAMLPRLFFLLALAASASARRAPAPSASPASFWTIETAPNAEVLAEAGTGAPEFVAPPPKTIAAAAAPAPSKPRRRGPRQSADVDDELAADTELDEVAVAANAFAQIAAGAQEIEALMGGDDAAAALDDDAALESSIAAALEQLPTAFVEIHDDSAAAVAAAPEALPVAAVAPHGLVAVGDDAIFAAANSAASSAAEASAIPSEFPDQASLEAALEAAAMTGNPLIVVDDDAIIPDAVPVDGEEKDDLLGGNCGAESHNTQIEILARSCRCC